MARDVRDPEAGERREGVDAARDREEPGDAPVGERTGDGGGQWTLNLKQGTTSGFLVDGLADDVNVTISMATADWTGIISGASNPMQAFMMGKIKVKGDMGLAMKLQNVLALAKG